MFTNISWDNYLLVITLLLTIYYLVIAFWFYSHELQTFFSGLRKPSIGPEPTKTSLLPDEVRSPAAMPEEWPEAFEAPNHPENQINNSIIKEDGITTEQKLAIAEAARKAKNKEEFILILQLVMQAHPDLKEISCRSAIMNLILAETEKYSSLSFTAADFKKLWLAADNSISADLPEENNPFV